MDKRRPDSLGTGDLTNDGGMAAQWRQIGPQVYTAQNIDTKYEGYWNKHVNSILADMFDSPNTKPLFQERGFSDIHLVTNLTCHFLPMEGGGQRQRQCSMKWSVCDNDRNFKILTRGQTTIKQSPGQLHLQCAWRALGALPAPEAERVSEDCQWCPGHAHRYSLRSHSCCHHAVCSPGPTSALSPKEVPVHLSFLDPLFSSL